MFYNFAISIPAPARGATTTTRRNALAILFQFPPLREGRRSSARPPRPCGNFNSRPCERGDLYPVGENEDGSISIPDPARGATG